MNRRKLFTNTLGLAGGLAANKVLPAEVSVPVETTKRRWERRYERVFDATADVYVVDFVGHYRYNGEAWLPIESLEIKK